MHEPPKNMQDEPEVNAEMNRARQIERDQMAEYFGQEAGKSFAVPAKHAGKSASWTDDVGEARIVGQFDTTHHGAEPAPRPRARIGVFSPYGHHVAAIAAALVAEHPGMFDGPDVLEPIRREPPIPGHFRYETIVMPPAPPLPSIERVQQRIAAEAHHVVVATDPPRQPASFAFEKPRRMGKPAGSKLARKAARGKL